MVLLWKGSMPTHFCGSACPTSNMHPNYYGKKLALVLLWSGEQPVGGAMFFADGLRAHYHLSALTDHGRACKAGTLAIVEGARWARHRGLSMASPGRWQ